MFLKEGFYKTKVGTYQIENNKNVIDVYPNPASSEITLSWVGLYHQLEIINSMGHKIMTLPIKDKHNQNINIEILLRGVYHINLYGNNSFISTKVVKL